MSTVPVVADGTSKPCQLADRTSVSAVTAAAVVPPVPRVSPVNDVVVTLCATAVREWLLARDELPDEPLVAMVPVSVRTEEQQGGKELGRQPPSQRTIGGGKRDDGHPVHCS